MEKIYIKNMSKLYSTVLKKNETATVFFLKKPSLVYYNGL